MKVYQLMDLLSNCPAGAEVEVHQLITIPELIKGGVQNQIEGGEYYSYNSPVTDIGDIPDGSNGTVYLYTD